MTLQLGFGGAIPRMMLCPIPQTSGSNADTTTVLNSAQVFGVSGGGVTLHIIACRPSSIKKVYLFNNAFTGTFANLKLKGEIRNERTPAASANQRFPGTTVRQAAVNATFAGSAAKHWIEFDFSAVPYTPAVGEWLFLNVFNNASAPSVDYPQLITTTGYSNIIIGAGTGPMGIATATNGFATTGTFAGVIPCVCVVEYADGTIDGNPYTKMNATFYANNALERGVVIDGLDSPLWCNGFILTGGSTAYSAINIYGSGSAGGTQSPGGTTLQSFPLGSTTGQINDGAAGWKYVTPFLLPAGQKLRITLTYSGSAQTPTVFQIEGATDFTDIVLAGYGGGTCGYSTIDNGASGWTDDKSAWGGISPLLSTIPPNLQSRNIYSGGRL